MVSSASGSGHKGLGPQLRVVVVAVEPDERRAAARDYEGRGSQEGIWNPYLSNIDIST
jgi:hypothetical protein